MSEKVFYVSVAVIATMMVVFAIIMVPKFTEQREKYDQCIIEYAREVPDLKTFCNSMSRI